MYLLTYLVEDVEVSLHLGRKKVQPPVTLSGGRDETVLLQGSDMMFGDAIVDVEGFGEPVDIVRLLAEKVDDPSPIGPTPRPRENIPQETLPRCV